MSRERTMSRRRAVQAIYQWQEAGQDIADIDEQFMTEQDMSRADVAYFQELLHKVPRYIDELDSCLVPYLDREIDELDSIERAVLRIGAYELKYRIDVPYRVVINEAVQSAKVYGADQSHKYVNGILDKVATVLRKKEISKPGSR